MQQCLRPDELEALARDPQALPVERIQHARDCARCAAELRALRRFLDPASYPDHRPDAAARARLDRALYAEAGLATGGSPLPGRPSRRRSPFARMRLGWVMATAAVLLLGIGLGRQLAPFGPRTSSGPAPSGLLRGEAPGSFFELQLGRLPDGGLRARFQIDDPSLEYRVTLLGEDLLPLSDYDSDGSLDLPAVALESGARFVRVEALRDGDLIEESAPQPIPAR